MAEGTEDENGANLTAERNVKGKAAPKGRQRLNSNLNKETADASGSAAAAAAISLQGTCARSVAVSGALT